MATEILDKLFKIRLLYSSSLTTIQNSELK